MDSRNAIAAYNKKESDPNPYTLCRTLIHAGTTTFRTTELNFNKNELTQNTHLHATCQTRNYIKRLSLIILEGLRIIFRLFIGLCPGCFRSAAGGGKRLTPVAIRECQW